MDPSRDLESGRFLRRIFLKKLGSWFWLRNGWKILEVPGRFWDCKTFLEGCHMNGMPRPFNNALLMFCFLFGTTDIHLPRNLTARPGKMMIGKWWLEGDPFLVKWSLFRGELLNFRGVPHRKRTCGTNELKTFIGISISHTVWFLDERLKIAHPSVHLWRFAVSPVGNTTVLWKEPPLSQNFQQGAIEFRTSPFSRAPSFYVSQKKKTTPISMDCNSTLNPLEIISQIDPHSQNSQQNLSISFIGSPSHCRANCLRTLGQWRPVCEGALGMERWRHMKTLVELRPQKR